MTATFCTVAGAVTRAGDGVNPTISVSSALVTKYIEQAQAYILAQIRYDFVANYASLQANTKQILEEVAECRAAIALINYDFAYFSSKDDVRTQLNVLDNTVAQNMAQLKSQELKDWLVGT